MAIQKVHLPQDERDDFDALVRKHGKNPGAFAIETMEDVPVQPGVIYRNVDVACGNKKVSYNGSHGTAWLVDFEKHLAAGVFP
jgi:hypothetical protein